jgi:hypothetical protein
MSQVDSFDSQRPLGLLWAFLYQSRRTGIGLGVENFSQGSFYQDKWNGISKQIKLARALRAQHHTRAMRKTMRCGWGCE